jgi:hypothetical protein
MALNRYHKEKSLMTSWTTKLATLAAVLLLPAVAFAGATLKEHECVGDDTSLDLLGRDAGCTPVGSEITPPGGDSYGTEDSDMISREAFTQSGAIEIIRNNNGTPAGTGQFRTVATSKRPGLLQVGFEATFGYAIGVKAFSVLSDIEVACSVCAEDPWGAGPRETFVPDTIFEPDLPDYEGGGTFFQKLNVDREPWEMWVTHEGSILEAKEIPGLDFAPGVGAWRDVEFFGCKQKVLVVRNPGNIQQNDLLNVNVRVPATARQQATMDVTSCELSYLRFCLFGEETFPNKQNACGVGECVPGTENGCDV